MTTTTNNMNSISTIVNNVLNKVDAWTRITLVNACKYMERTGFASYPVEIPLDKLSIPEFQSKQLCNNRAKNHSRAAAE